jgi:hypothetical protein
MDIELKGLTDRQVVFCDIMWTISSKKGVEAFIATLPKPEAQECRTLMQLMLLEFIDAVDGTDDAQDVIDKARK